MKKKTVGPKRKTTGEKIQSKIETRPVDKDKENRAKSTMTIKMKKKNGK